MTARLADSPLRPAIDLRSEVVARIPDAIWDAMRNAEAQWSVPEPDPYVCDLENRLADLTDKEAALFVTTGSLGNILGVLGLADRGSFLVLERRCHIYCAEGNSTALIANVGTRLLDGGRLGFPGADTLAAALDETRELGQPASLVCIENTHNICGGTTASPGQMDELVAVAKSRGARVFVDGARLWNAAAAHDTSLAAMLSGADGAMISLNKCLGAPIGAVLVGSGELIQGARVAWRQLGSAGMHRMGHFAAGALAALDTMLDRIPEDHRRARLLAQGLADIEGISVDLEAVQTNLVRIEMTAKGLDGRAYVKRLADAGIGARVVEPPSAVKFNVHWDIDDTAVMAVVDVTKEIVASAAA